MPVREPPPITTTREESTSRPPEATRRVVGGSLEDAISGGAWHWTAGWPIRSRVGWRGCAGKDGLVCGGDSPPVPAEDHDVGEDVPDASAQPAGVCLALKVVPGLVENLRPRQR